MSLLLDQCSLFHPEQVRRIKNNFPACTYEKVLINVLYIEIQKNT